MITRHFLFPRAFAGCLAKASMISVICVAMLAQACADERADESAAGVSAAELHAYEQAYANASHVANGTVESFDAQRGARVRVTEVLRGGKLKPDALVYLDNTADFPFLDAPGALVTVFIDSIGGDSAALYHGPTQGGLIWQQPETVGYIAAAFADPDGALFAAQPRERLAGAYYLALKGAVSAERQAAIVDAATWGIAQADQPTNQAAVRALAFLNIDVERVAGPYHPGYKLALKQAAAKRLETWWAGQSGDG